jgi:tRNA (cytidine/uridine-2'-O-)-methyltransferase
MQPRFDDNVTPMHYNPRLHIVLFEPEIPHNAGSVGRTCVAVGAKLWLVRPFGFRLDDHHLKRAGLDYWQHLEWEAVDNWSALLEKLPPTRRWLFSKRAKHPYYETQFQEGDVLVFGNESQGLPEAMLEAAGHQALRIPIREQVRSLNLSNSVAILCYEALRQWQIEPAHQITD